MKTEIQLVTPDAAKSYLAKNLPTNRKVTQRWVDTLSNIIIDGEWVTTHQGIALNEENYLVDGQHRLLAIVKSNTPCAINVSTNVPVETFKATDCGVKRSMSQLTGLDKKQSEACKYIAEKVSKYGAYSPDFILEIDNSILGDFHRKLIAKCGTNKKVISSAPMRVAAVALMADGKDEKYILDVYSNLMTSNFNELPPIAHSFLKQMIAGTLASGFKTATLARGLKLFNFDYKDMRSLRVSEAEEGSAVSYLKCVYESAIGKAI